MNEILVLERIGDPDDGMFSCYTGTVNGNRERSLATFGCQRRAEGLIDAYLRKTGKAVGEYCSTEDVLRDFLEFCRTNTIECRKGINFYNHKPEVEFEAYKALYPHVPEKGLREEWEDNSGDLRHVRLCVETGQWP